jgi:ABC-2 type transport system ATP-binding protein
MVIRLEALTKSFAGVVALNQVDLHVKPGELFGLVGPDGAGKTTLMRTICGLMVPDDGQGWVMGYPLSETEKIKDQFGYMPQRFGLYGDLTVSENIDIFGALYGLGIKTIRQRAKGWLEVTGLADFQSRLAANLSGGMKQKLALTCALITRPQLLILDEPTYGVDPQSRKEFWKMLYRLNQEGRTILVSTAYMDEAELCSTVAFMAQGRVAAVASPLELKRNFPFELLEVRTEVREPHLFDGVEGAVEVSFYGDRYHIMTADLQGTWCAVEAHLQARGISLVSLRQIAPSMEDVFVALVEMGEGS